MGTMLKLEMKGFLREIMDLHVEMFIRLQRLESLECIRGLKGSNLQVEKAHNLEELLKEATEGLLQLGKKNWFKLKKLRIGRY